MIRLLVSFLGLLLIHPTFATTDGASRDQSKARSPDSSRFEETATPLEAFAAHPTYENIKISPTGDYLAATYFNPLDVTESRLVVLDIKNMEVTAIAHVRGREFIGSFFWANDERIVGRIAKKVGWQDAPFMTGDMVAMNWDGKKKRWIFGQRKKGGRSVDGATILSTLPKQRKKILIASNDFTKRDGSYTEAILLDIYNGRERRLARAPMKGAQLITDHSGKIRYSFSTDPDKDNAIVIHKRESNDWKKVSEYEVTSGRIQPVGFAPDNESMYVLDNIESDVDTLLLLNPELGISEKIYQSPSVDISSFEIAKDGTLVGVYTEPDYPAYAPTDTKHPMAEVMSQIKKTFAGYRVRISSSTADESSLILSVESDTNPEVFLLYQRDIQRFSHLADTRPSISPSNMAKMEPFNLTVRDGVTVPVYLTLPKHGSAPFPLVVIPHGGPHGVRDYWGFSSEVQMLASQGFAVLQVNFRGSGGYGRDFLYSGYKRWGLEMQDDVTDATIWAIDEGFTKTGSICISGASYGGYAALMGAVKQPDLYSCVIAVVGVYDLEMMLEKGDIPQSRSGRNYLSQALGDDRADLFQRSPINQIEKIKAPVLIVHGAKDRRVPIEQAEALRARLNQLKKPYEWLVKRNEGHGFYAKENRVELFKTMVEFLNKNIKSN